MQDALQVKVDVCSQRLSAVTRHHSWSRFCTAESRGLALFTRRSVEIERGIEYDAIQGRLTDATQFED